MMRPATEDISERRPVWEALSDLFLDTELQPYHYTPIASVLAGSPYSLEEIKTILIDEVYPVLIWNLQTVAGEWAAFDGDRLQAAILKRNQSWFKPPRWMHIGHWMIREDWKKIIEIFKQQRSTTGDTAQ